MSPDDIISHIPHVFDKALSEGDLLFFPSTVYKHEESNIEVRDFILACLMHWWLGNGRKRAICITKLSLKPRPLYWRKWAHISDLLLFSMRFASVLRYRRSRPSRLLTSIRMSSHKRNYRFRTTTAGDQILSPLPMFRTSI
jgi:hypothetical protein